MACHAMDIGLANYSLSSAFRFLRIDGSMSALLSAGSTVITIYHTACPVILGANDESQSC